MHVLDRPILGAIIHQQIRRALIELPELQGLETRQVKLQRLIQLRELQRDGIQPELHIGKEL